MKKRYTIILLIFIACSNRSPVQLPGIPEFQIQKIKLPAPLSEANAEISGLTMKSDSVFILPQYPDRFGKSPGIVFITSELQIKEAINSNSELQLAEIKLQDKNELLALDGFQGFEAIAFIGDQVFLTIECESSDKVSGYLASGNFRSGSLYIESIIEIPLPRQIHNMAWEAITVFKGKVYLMYEANGQHLKRRTYAVQFDPAKQSFKRIVMPNIEYRITDAGKVNSTGMFYILNYFYPGEKELMTAGPDSLMQKFGIGSSHKTSAAVERLVQLKIEEQGIALTEASPKYLALLASEDSRNWEGLAMMSDGSFIIATDKFPETILAKITGISKNAGR